MARAGSPADTPCHYVDCPGVYARAPPAGGLDADWNATSSWTVVAPNAGPVTVPVASFTVGGLVLTIRNASGTIAALRDASDASGFSFAPAVAVRADAGYRATGNLTLRVRGYGAGGAYTTSTTTVVGKHGPAAPQVPPSLPGGFWANDLTPLLGVPGLSVFREYGAAADGLGVTGWASQ